MRTPTLPSTLLMAGLTLFGACTAPVDGPGDMRPPDGVAPVDPVDPNACAAVDFPWLAEGSTWEVAWGEIEARVDFFDGGSGDYDAGNYLMRLGAPFEVEGITMYPVVLDGDVDKHVPQWTALGTDGCGRVFGQTGGGGALRLVYVDGSWSGTGFYTRYGGFEPSRVEVVRNTTMIPSAHHTAGGDFGTVTGVGYTESSRGPAGSGCEYFEGHGTICGSDDPGDYDDETIFEYWDEVAGPIGFHAARNYQAGGTRDMYHLEQRAEVTFYTRGIADVVFPNEPDSYAAPNELAMLPDEASFVLGSVHERDLPSGYIPGYSPSPNAAQAHDWYRFEVSEENADAQHAVLLESADDTAFEMRIYTAPGTPVYGFLEIGSSDPFAGSEHPTARWLHGTLFPGTYLVSVTALDDTPYRMKYQLTTYCDGCR